MTRRPAGSPRASYGQLAVGMADLGLPRCLLTGAPADLGGGGAREGMAAGPRRRGVQLGRRSQRLDHQWLVW